MEQKQVVKSFECYGNNFSDKVNDFLVAYPAYRIKTIVPLTIGYAGGDTAPGIVVVFECD